MDELDYKPPSARKDANHLLRTQIGENRHRQGSPWLSDTHLQSTKPDKPKPKCRKLPEEPEPTKNEAQEGTEVNKFHTTRQQRVQNPFPKLGPPVCSRGTLPPKKG